MKSPHKGIARIIYAFKYSLDGLISAFKTESAFRQDTVKDMLSRLRILQRARSSEKMMMVLSMLRLRSPMPMPMHGWRSIFPAMDGYRMR